MKSKVKNVNKENVKSLSWNKLNEISEEYGDSFYILEMDRFRSNFDRIKKSFREYYPRTSIGYSFKTNYLPHLCREAYERGAYAEVVSRMEYDLALKLGIDTERIIFNGPVKRRNDLKEALLNGSVVNLDSLSEVKEVCALASEYPSDSFSVGLRCNFDIGAEQRSRFGLAVDNGQLKKGFEAIEESENCEVTGLHFHSSAQRGVDSYITRTRKLITLSNSLFKGRDPEYLDIGGGFFSPVPQEMREQFSDRPPEYEEYAEAIGPLFAEAFGTQAGPELILEPGVGLVADVMRFVARVTDVRSLGDRNVATTTGSVQNIKPTKNSINLPVNFYPKNNDRSNIHSEKTYELVGYTCMEDDVLHDKCKASLERGDFVEFCQVGAYSFVFKPPFIDTAPPIISKKPGEDRWAVLRRREKLSDIMDTYEFEI